MIATEEAREQLVAAARKAAENAYAPYSGFPVGAALLTEEGEIISGCNVENASYGLTICAERNAVFQAVARGARGIVAIAVFAPTDAPTPPCGACRQVLSEFGPDAEVICVGNGEEIVRFHVSELLPESFGARNLAAK